MYLETPKVYWALSLKWTFLPDRYPICYTYINPIQCTWKYHRNGKFEQYPGSKMNFCYQISNLIAGVILCNIVLGNTTGCLLSSESQMNISTRYPICYTQLHLHHPVLGNITGSFEQYPGSKMNFQYNCWSHLSCTWKYQRKTWDLNELCYQIFNLFPAHSSSGRTMYLEIP